MSEIKNGIQVRGVSWNNGLERVNSLIIAVGERDVGFISTCSRHSVVTGLCVGQ